MSSYRQNLYHLVIRTKNSLPAINQNNADQLYAYISGIIKNKESHLYRTNGIENHIHILTDIHPSIALADFVRDLKVSTSLWMKKNRLFPGFHGWADGYGSFTCAFKDLDVLIDYINTQKKHHRKKTFEEEYRLLIQECGIMIDERFFP
jgi:REP element-mobilizing transposase RayT